MIGSSSDQEGQGTQRRSTRACDNCKSRRTKCEVCEGFSACKNCNDNELECTFRAPVRKRGPQPGVRKLDPRSMSPRPVERWPNKASRPSSPPPPRRTPVSNPSPSGSLSEGKQQRLPFGGVPGKLVDRLLPLYFAHVHNVWPLVYKATFNPHTAPLPLLLSMLAIAACVTPTIDGEKTPAERLFRMAENRVLDSRNDCRVDLIQALLLLSLRQTGCGDKRSASMYAGRACCMALNMGLNLAPGNIGKVHDPIEKEIRARVYWNTYVLDKTVAEETGRPFLLSYRRTTTPLPSVTELEEYEVWPPPTMSATVPLSVNVVPRRGYVLSCFAWTCRLAMLVEDILDLEPQAPPITDEWDGQFLRLVSEEARQETDRAAKQLDAWKSALPVHLLIDRNVSPVPHQAVLLAICSEAAQETIDILTLLDRYQLLNVASSDVLHILSLAALFEAFNTTSPDMDVAHKAKVNFAQCCIWLREFSKSWPAASSHRVFFEGLIQGGLRISHNEETEPSDPLPNSSDANPQSPSMPAGLHAIRRNLSISEAPSPSNLANVSPVDAASLNPANLFQLPQLYWNHLNTANLNPNLTWDPTVNFAFNTTQASYTNESSWDSNQGQLDLPEGWMEAFASQPTEQMSQESSLTADAVQSALMSFMMQAARGGE